jgi:Uma2 family endonuclease
MSANDEAVQAKNKMEEWIANGCSLAWLIDPAKEIAYVYRQGQEVEEIKGFGNKLSGDEILPGFVLDLKLLV